MPPETDDINADTDEFFDGVPKDKLDPEEDQGSFSDETNSKFL